MEWGWGCASAPLWCPPSAAPKRPSTLAGWLAGAFDRARAATCFDAPPSLVSLRLALSSCEAMAAARASPPGPFTGVQPRYPDPQAPCARPAASALILFFQSIKLLDRVKQLFGDDPRRQCFPSRKPRPEAARRAESRPRQGPPRRAATSARDRIPRIRPCSRPRTARKRFPQRGAPGRASATAL